MITGLIGAMREEILQLKDEIKDLQTETQGCREFLRGFIGEEEVVMCLSGWGKVAAASTATSLINLYGAGRLLFIGLAGSLQSHLNIGDIVVADRLIQHDVDLSRLEDFRHIEAPFWRNFSFAVDPAGTDRALEASREFCRRLGEGRYPAISAAYHPQVHVGAIASGDQFIASAQGKERIRERFPEALCAEMEGGALAQVAADYGVPCTVIRIISDQADESAHDDFSRFLFRDISRISVALAERLFLAGC
ncbi:MAG: 5'-methylthioadenosine/adenosylhomocysteine nucleosidase [Mangrovibacterium sp.]